MPNIRRNRYHKQPKNEKGIWRDVEEYIKWGVERLSCNHIWTIPKNTKLYRRSKRRKCRTCYELHR